jgi:hypothetical protein
VRVQDESAAPLAALRDVDASQIVLRKPSWRSGLHDLVAGETLVGRLDVSSWSGGSDAEAADGHWRFERPRGLTARTVRVLSVPDAHELAVVRRAKGGRQAELELDGHRYELRAHGWWKPRWTWTEGGDELGMITARDTFRGERGRVELTELGLASPHASLLALLGAHLAFLSNREGNAAAAAGATAATTAGAASG